MDAHPSSHAACRRAGHLPGPLVKSTPAFGIYICARCGVRFSRGRMTYVRPTLRFDLVSRDSAQMVPLWHCMK